MSLPPLPPGFKLTTDSGDDLPPLPDGFELVEPQKPAPRKRKGIFGQGGNPNATAVDGDTANMRLRIFGVDAPEKGQTGIGYDYSTQPIGANASAFMRGQLTPDAEVNILPGQTTYGRAVATVTNAQGQDVGEQALRTGNAILSPQYIKDPKLLARYKTAEAEARDAKRGLWAGSFRTPADYRQFQKTGEYPSPLGINITGKPGDEITVAAPGTTFDWNSEEGRNQGAEMLQHAIADGLSFEQITNMARQMGLGSADPDALRKALAERDARGVAPTAKVNAPAFVSADNPQASTPVANSEPSWGQWARNQLDQAGLALGVIDPSTYRGRNPDGSLITAEQAKKMPTIAKAPAPRTNWQIAKDNAAEMFDTAGRGVNAAFMRANQSEREKALIDQLVGFGKLTPEQAAQAKAKTAAANAANIRETRNQQDAFAAADEARQPDQSLDAWAKRKLAGIAGGAVGDFNPTNLIAPGSSTVGRIAAQAGVNAIVDAGTQAAEMSQGIQDGFDWKRMAVNALVGATIQGVIELPGGVKRIVTSNGKTVDVPAGEDISPLLETYGQKQPSAPQQDLPPLPDGFELVEPQKPAAPLDRERIAYNDEGLNDAIMQSAPLPRPEPSAPAAPDAYRPLATPAVERAALADIQPGDVTPILSNEVGSIDEAVAASQGRFAPVPEPDEFRQLTPRQLPTPSGATATHKGPVDLVTWIRTKGGLLDQGGELSAMGIKNGARDMDFARGEQRFGPVVSKNGMALDDAANRAWEEGYLPDFPERPTVQDFLNAIEDTYKGNRRAFLPEDFPEIDRFEAARTERLDAEKARKEGNPLFVDKGEPATLADVEANRAPISAYEDWPNGGPDFAGNINLNKLQSPKDIKRALSTIDKRVSFDDATRGRVTQAETERLASELGMTADDLLTRRKGQALNAEEALAARQILAKSGNELVNMAKRVQSMDNPGDEILAGFQDAIMRHVAIQEQVAGMTAEAGRTLAQFRMMADASKVPRKVLSAKVARGGGVDHIKDAADIIVDTFEAAPDKFNSLTRDIMKPKLRDKLIELWYNSLLSGPQTHAVNLVGNTMTALSQIPEHAVAATIGRARTLRPGASPDRVLFSEVGQRAVGLMAGAREGMREAAQAFRTGEPSDFVTKVEAQSQKAISGLKGELIRLPTRALTASDEFFKAIARRMELHGQAMRMVKLEGLKGEAARNRVKELVANPTDEMMERAMDYGRYMTFQRPLGPAGNAITGFTENMPVAKLVLPFVRTPANLLKYSVERSPAAPLLKEWRADWKAGGARRDLAVARAMIGTGVAMVVADLAEQGLITGGPPTDEGRERMMRANGWQPYSVKIDGKYYSYSRLDPFSTTIGFAADMATKGDGLTKKQQDDAAVMIVASIMGNLSNKTWLSGVSDMTEALNDPQRYAKSFLQRMLGAVTVPTGVNQIARINDPVARSREEYIDAVRSRIPGMSSALYPQRDIFGREIRSEGGIGPDIISPVWQSTDRNDPVAKALIADRITIGKPQRNDMPAKEWDAFQKRGGELVHQGLAMLVTSPDWQQMDNATKTKAVRKIVTESRKAAKEELFGGTPPKKEKAQPFSLIPKAKADTNVPSKSDVYNTLLNRIPGIQVTSGFRTPEYQADMRRRGYHPSPNSNHLLGAALDLNPPPGKSMAWLRDRVNALYPNARFLNEGDHLHTTFPGYRSAPVLGGAKSWGLENPYRDMPPLPPGFELVK